MDVKDMQEYIEKKIGAGILSQLSDEGWLFYYKAIHDFKMDVYDADRWAWLNTLFGYDIGHDYAEQIISWLYENGQDVYDLSHRDKGTIEAICEGELGIHLEYDKFLNFTPDLYEYHAA